MITERRLNEFSLETEESLAEARELILAGDGEFGEWDDIIYTGSGYTIVKLGDRIVMQSNVQMNH